MNIQEVVYAPFLVDISRNYTYFDLVTWAGQMTLQVSNIQFTRGIQTALLADRLLNSISKVFTMSFVTSI